MTADRSRDAATPPTPSERHREEYVVIEKRGTFSHLWRLTVCGVFVQEFAFEESAEKRAAEFRSALARVEAAARREERERGASAASLPPADALARALYEAHIAELIDHGEITRDDAEPWDELPEIDTTSDDDPVDRRGWRTNARYVLAFLAETAPSSAPPTNTTPGAIPATREDDGAALREVIAVLDMNAEIIHAGHTAESWEVCTTPRCTRLRGALALGAQARPTDDGALREAWAAADLHERNANAEMERTRALEAALGEVWEQIRAKGLVRRLTLRPETRALMNALASERLARPDEFAGGTHGASPQGGSDSSDHTREVK